ncbi:GTPase domain-containing protein [Bacillus sp. V5-8f]|uniref:GTPase domain-containing protein n=1 Tax=Bacillus sp. V5-8f TaxID=2053044 RepID=UPI000C794E73|nr:GTPase domain-containing protein [Bacillus sp. V5-8f]PLT32911.1 GTP-binding protein [Bacillus sp. V5-8f]
MEENTFITKKYYETLLDSEKPVNPLEALGDAFLAEQKKEIPDLTPLRFAQGEVYFHYKDYEAAIFKWGNVIGELEQWAKKNIADAYYEMGILSTAEEMYKSISTDSLVLRAEVALQLFSLYIEEERFDLASRTIKEVVSFHPDYPNVTDLARVFFEEQKDYSSAIELAVNESIRTESLRWFDALQIYVEEGYTKDLPPEYFLQVMQTMFKSDHARFEKLVLSLWDIYKQQDAYFSWLVSLNHFFLQEEIGEYDKFQGLSTAYKDTYLELIDGRYFIREIEGLVPGLLSSWLKLVDETNALFSSASVLSWSEIFPDKVHSLPVSDAEHLLMNSRNYMKSLEESQALLGAIELWAEQREVQISQKDKWMVRQLLNLETKHLLLAGPGGTGKSSFINTVLGEEIIQDTTSAFVFVKDSDQSGILEISDNEIKDLPDLESISKNRSQRDSFFEIGFPSEFLHRNGISLIDTPGVNGNELVKYEIYNLLNASDGLLFVLDAQSPFTDRERDMIIDMKRKSPYTQVHFLLNKMDKVNNDQDALRILEETTARIQSFLPKSKVFAFSVDYNNRKNLDDLAQFLSKNFQAAHHEDERADKLLYFIRKVLTSMLDKRVEMESKLVDSISWNEDMVVKLNGAINQLNDLEKEKTRNIKNSYRLIKEDVKKELNAKIPEILRDCAEMLKEDSDFRRIHIELNEAMNDRIQEYINHTALPKFYTSLKGWISEAKEEFSQSQYYLEEMADGFNSMYGTDRMNLECDFKVLDDWRRDADRLTSGAYIEEVNILMRHTPAQLLLKSAGKLFGAIGQNNTALYTRYKKFLETQDYEDVTASIIRKFFSQFELFEKSIDRDISLFFRNPLSNLNDAVEEAHTEIKDNKAALQKMREKPELFRDPINLFEVRLRQYEWMLNAREINNNPQLHSIKSS